MKMKRNFLVVTKGEHIPINALYVGQQLLERRQNVALLREINQKSKSWKYRWKYYRRLLKKRGLFTFVDNILLSILSFAYLASFISTEGGHETFEEIVFPGSSHLRSSIEDYKARMVWHDTTDVNSAESEQFVRQFGPDVIILAGAPIIKENIFKLAKDMAINMHLGITPAYQGSTPFIWAIANHDFNNIGFTIHHVAQVVDSGPIILQREKD